MTDLDTALRDMLRDRARDITTPPAGFGVPDELDAGHRHHRDPRRTTWLVAAVVAAVLAVGGTTLAVRSGGHDGDRIAPVRSARVSPSSSTGAPVVARRTCPAAASSAWRSAFTTTDTYGARAATPLAFAGRDLVVSRDFGSSRDVALVAPDGTTRTVFTVPEPNRNQVLSAAADGAHLVVPVSRLPRNANGVIPVIVRIDVVDLRTGAAATVATAPVTTGAGGVQGRTIDSATIYRGTVYYDVRATFTTRTATIHGYDVARRADRVVGTSLNGEPDRGPVVQARGLYWSPQDTAPAITAALPPAVGAALSNPRAARSLVTDGTTYAYSPRGDEIAFWAPGMAVPTVFRTGGTSDFPDAVAGRVVVLEDVAGTAGHRALDTRTGAVVPADALSDELIGNSGVLVGYPQTSPSAVVRVDTATLPTLAC